jgi:hypothetical protein
MKYIKLDDSRQPVNYSIEQFAIDFPNARIYNNTAAMPDPYLLGQYNVYQLVTTNPPILEETQTTEEGTPRFYDGEWYQTWNTRDLTLEEIDELIAVRTPIPADPEVAVSFFASEETVTQRSELCNNCPSYSQLKICAECRCIMPLKVKIKSSVCPIGKW